MTRRASGFTLIELLVALTLVGLLSAGLFGGLRLGARAWETGGARIAETNDIEAARTFLRKRLAQVQALSYTAAGGDTVFDGGRDRLRFAAAWPAHLGGVGSYVFELRPGPDGALLLDWALFRPAGPVAIDTDRKHPRRLFADAAHVQFRYYGRRDDGEDAGWHDTWRDGDRLPRVIEIRWGSDGPRDWPPLRAAVATARR